MEQGSEEDPKEENEIQGLFVPREQCGVGAKSVCPRVPKTSFDSRSHHLVTLGRLRHLSLPRFPFP